MRIEGQQTIAASRPIVWSLIHDPVILRRLLPGCKSLEPSAADEYWLELAVRIGPSVEHLSGTLRFDQTAAPQRFAFNIDVGSAFGGVISHGRVVLEERGPDLTTLLYDAEIDLTGRPATVSARMLETTARSFARRSLEALAQQVAIRTRVYTTTVSSPQLVEKTSGAPRRDADRVVLERRLLFLLSIVLAAVALWRKAGRDRAAGIAGQSLDSHIMANPPAVTAGHSP